MSSHKPSRRPLWVGTLAGLLATILVLPSSSRAADLDPGYADVPAPIPQQMVAFGSGWYIRGDIGATRRENVSPSSSGFDTTDVTSIPVAPELSSRQGSDLGYTASIGGGYKFTNWFRADAVFDYNQPVKASFAGPPSKCPGGYVQVAPGIFRPGLQGCQASYSAQLNSFDVLVNGYVDLGTYSIVTPYIGAGVGMAFGNYNTSATFKQSNGEPYDIDVTDPSTGATYHLNFDSAKSGTYYNFAYALMAGAAIDIYDHLKLDIGYRYLNLGKIKGVTTSSMYQHQVRAGLRYMIDN